AYGDNPDNKFRYTSAASRIARALHDNPNVTIDVGQVMFGQTVTLSGDVAHQHRNMRHAKPKKSVLLEIDGQTGCGVVPFQYSRRSFVSSLQWAIGLELFLMVDDPSRVFLTTDHPNGGPFDTYPHLLQLLMDASARATATAEIDSDAAAATELDGMNREYSLADVAMMTRAAPAAILGMRDRGNLREGSIADVVAYQPDDNLQKMFSRPALVMRAGQVLDLEGDTDAVAEHISHRAPKHCLIAEPIIHDLAAVQKHYPQLAGLHIGQEEMREHLGTDCQTIALSRRVR
ncbi:MAG: amidohydrolase family protein, partial [Planctomycetota bacterium]